MKNVPENELFSAYLDGELTAEEQAEIERLLAASPAARQLVDELRALSTSLQALPSHAIGEDISGQVLRKAERRMLSEPTAARPRKPEASQAEVPTWRVIVRRVARPRTLAWSGVAVAVALLLMVMESGRLQEPRDRRPVAIKTPAAADESEATSGAAPSIQANEEMAEQAAPDRAVFAELPPSEPLRSRPGFVVGKADARPPAAEPPGAPTPMPPPPAPFAESPVPATEPAKSSPKGEGRGQAGYGFAGRFGTAGGVESAGKRGKVAGVPARREPVPEDAPSVAAKEAERAGVAAGPESMGRTMPGQPGPEVQQAETSLVVWGNVTAEAVRDQVFERLLEKQQIAPAEGVERREGRPSGASGRTHQDELRMFKAVKEPVEVIQWEIEGTRDQIMGLLADLSGRPAEFTLLSHPSALRDGPPDFRGFHGPGQVPTRGSAGTPLYEAVQSVTDDADAAPQKKADQIEPGKLPDVEEEPKLQEGQVAQPKRETAEAEESETAEPSMEGAVEQTPVGTPGKDAEKPKAEPGQSQQPATRAQTEESDREVRKYYVRFVFQVVKPDLPNVAASVAKESPQAEAASEAAAPAEVEAMELPAAEAAEPADVEP